jgi:alkanesulfonate monooxygenase SsuD/methylene tetrahydromethanopterin reductase-like flavin-dependent oxidoreductase (luciferase family)
MGKIRFHANLLPMYFPDRQPPFSQYFQDILEEVALAEELGFEGYWFTEHHFLLYGGPIPNPAVFISAAAARTSRIRLGSAISILPLHEPVQTAEDYAMADAISGGRLDFGIGRGNTQLDYEVYGVNRDDSRARFEEAGEIIAGAWEQECFAHEGRFWKFGEVSVQPRPVQQPRPPIWVAGNSRDSGLWAGRHGFELMSVAHTFPPEHARIGVDAWREGLAERGETREDHRLQLLVRIWVDEDGETARETALAGLKEYDRLASIGRNRSMLRMDDPDRMLAEGRNIYGNPDQCIQGVRNAAANFEFDTLACVFNWGGIPHDSVKRAMRLFAKEVIPAFA